MAVEFEDPTNVYKLIGDKCNLSEKTVRSAFGKRPVTYQTACKIRKALNLPTLNCFRIKTDNRGRKSKTSA